MQLQINFLVATTHSPVIKQTLITASKSLKQLARKSNFNIRVHKKLWQVSSNPLFPAYTSCVAYFAVQFYFLE